MVTGLYAALLSFLLIALSVNVIKGRLQKKVALGDDNNYDLQKRIRAHSNFTEYTPIFLILLGVLEYLDLPYYGLHILGLLFLGARLTHAYGLTIAERIEGEKLLNSQYRACGMVGTFMVIGLSALLVLILLIIHFSTPSLG